MVFKKKKNDLDKNKFWYKDAIIYELSVRSFFDANNDGVGDFQGLIQKLDYLEDLGINALWLLPFYPSPLKDDGYDVSHYCAVHPDCGTLSDFKKFLKVAHEKGFKVIIDLPLNHTSDQHPWFQRSRKSKKGTKIYDYYVWSESSEKYQDARVVLQGEENSNWTWDTQAQAFYWHRFNRFMPELNFESQDVQVEVKNIVDFWLTLGIDGFRLASVSFLFEEEGTPCENLPQTHDFIKKLRTHIDKNFSGKILIGETNLWPEEAVQYFGEGDECQMNFHYPLMPRLFLALQTEDSFPVMDIMDQTPAAPPGTQWALFLRNHDELGLEMVSEEDKDFMFRAYGKDPFSKFNVGIKRRLAPLLNNDRRKIELLHVLLFSLPGSPVMYYGDEIGMGDNVFLGSRLGVRTPMQWNMGQNAGFSQTNPQRLFLPVVTDPMYRYESINVAVQEENPSSLMWWIKQIIAMRKRFPVFGWGELKFLDTGNAKVLAFLRSYEEQQVIVVTNLSQYSQAVNLNLEVFNNCELTEIFSQNRFPPIASGNYPITLGPYGYFWFQVDVQEKKKGGDKELSKFQSALSWDKIFSHYAEIRILERKILPFFLKKCRWFGGKAKALSKVKIQEHIVFKVGRKQYYFILLEVHYGQGLPELYFLPLSFVATDTLLDKVEYLPQSVVCSAEIQGKSGFIMDSCYDQNFREALFENLARKTSMEVEKGFLEFKASVFSPLKWKGTVSSQLLKMDQSNTAILYQDQYFFKFYRKIEREINPDLELVRFLSENTAFKNSPRYVGSMEYRDKENRTLVLGMMQEKVENQGESWGMTVDAVGRYFERVLVKGKHEVIPPLLEKPVLQFGEAPPVIQALIGNGFFERIYRLGLRTAEMHLALSSDTSTPEFSPEWFTPNYLQSIHSSMRKLLKDRFALLKKNFPTLSEEVQVYAKKVLDWEDAILACFSEILKVKTKAIRTRIHGDFHLGQVLFTGKDFVIIDFEGEPGFSFSERRLKKSPLKDVAGMMRSIHYAAFGKILLNENYRKKDLEFLEPWAEQWQHYVNRFYLGAYMERMGMGKEWSHDYDILLQNFLLEKAIYELGYELNGRPDWVIIPLRGIDYLMKRFVMENNNPRKK